MLYLIIAGLALAIALALAAVRVPARHRWRRSQARTMCEQLQGVDRDQPSALVLARIRAMDALAFEEPLLTSFERKECEVIRNRRYTGDGGVDGRVIVHGRIRLIQAKRYASAIRPGHVRSFTALCERRHQPGLFIHTGRIAGMSREALAGQARIEILSGDRLMALPTGRSLTIGGPEI